MASPNDYRIASIAFCHNAMLQLSSVAHSNNGVDRISNGVVAGEFQSVIANERNY